MERHSHLLLVGVFLARRMDSEISIDPNEVKIATRVSWCSSQISSCALLCGDTGLDTNSCDHNTLDYACICGNSTAPGLQYYTETMPTFICDKAYENCVDNANGDSTTTGECEDNIKSHCGTLDPASVSKNDSSTAASAVGSSSAIAASAALNTVSRASAADSPSSSDSSSRESELGEGDNSGLSSGTRVGIGIGVVVLVIAIISLVAFAFFRLGKKRGSSGDKSEFKEANAQPFTKLGTPIQSAESLWSDYETKVHEVPVELDTRQPDAELHAYKAPVEMPGGSVIIAELPGSPVFWDKKTGAEEDWNTRHR